MMAHKATPIHQAKKRPYSFNRIVFMFRLPQFIVLTMLRKSRNTHALAGRNKAGLYLSMPAYRLKLSDSTWGYTEHANCRSDAMKYHAYHGSCVR